MTKTKLLALLLVLTLAFTFLASCSKNDDGNDVVYTDPYAQYEDYDEKSQKLYDDILGEFYTAYTAAKAATTDSQRYALMAVAEAKLLETALMLPTSSNGGNYAISKAAPYTVPFALWGNDSYRYHDILVADKFITAEHRSEMKAKWAEVKGTGTYYDWAKNYLTEKGYTLQDSYDIVYTSDPETWDVLATSQTVDSEAIVNTYDGLVEYDCEGTIAPALASTWTVSDDGLKYTFTLRSGLQWVDSQGRKVADVKADDFVAGMQHMMDSNGDLGYLVAGVIANAAEYMDGTVTDMAEVGVKAINDTTVEYTLCQPTSYFMTMLGYGVFAPMSREYYTSKGGKFGSEFDSGAETYVYGTTPDNIAYCGPYVVSSATAENSIVFSANPTYWDADNIAVSTIKWLYSDGKDASKTYKDALAGTLDGAGLNATSLELARTEKPQGSDKTYFELYGYVSATDATTFSSFYNINRTVLSNVSDGSAQSPKSEADNTRSTAALRNVHFRRAISFALDKSSYNAQVVGEELKLTSLRNTYTPGNFVYLTEDVTIKINGADKTFAKGTAYGAIVQAQLDADGVKIKAWDPNAEDGAGSSDGFDGWYSVENARAELSKAIEELAAIGIEVSAENPIYLDYPCPSFSPTYLNKANAYKQSLETALEGKVKFNMVDCTDAQQWYDAGYFTNYGSEANYDIYDLSGWGPDYGDPATYLDTFLPDYAGYMVKCIGIF